MSKEYPLTKYCKGFRGSGRWRSQPRCGEGGNVGGLMTDPIEAAIEAAGHAVLDEMVKQHEAHPNWDDFDCTAIGLAALLAGARVREQSLDASYIAAHQRLDVIRVELEQRMSELEAERDAARAQAEAEATALREVRALLNRGSIETAVSLIDAALAAYQPVSQSAAGARCPKCDGEGVLRTDTGGNHWQTECGACGGTGKPGDTATGGAKGAQELLGIGDEDGAIYGVHYGDDDVTKAARPAPAPVEAMRKEQVLNSTTALRVRHGDGSGF